MSAFGVLKVILNVILFITELYVLIYEYIVNLLTWLSGGDVGWTDPDVRCKLEMIRMWDR